MTGWLAGWLANPSVASSVRVCVQGQHGARLREVRWRVVVFDEFHQCKKKGSEVRSCVFIYLGRCGWTTLLPRPFQNQSHHTHLTHTQAYGAAKALKARMKIGLTGTPIQNDMAPELWALLSIVAPSLAGNEGDFKKEYANPIKRKQKRTASAEVVEAGKAASAEMEALLKKVVLARDKRTIQHKLHGKQEFIIFCPLTDIQVRTPLHSTPHSPVVLLFDDPRTNGRVLSRTHLPSVLRPIPVYDSTKSTRTSSPFPSSASSSAARSPATASAEGRPGATAATRHPPSAPLPPRALSSPSPARPSTPRP